MTRRAVLRTLARTLAARVLAACALGACTFPDSAADRGTPPPIEATVLQEEAVLRLSADENLPVAERDALERAVRLVALGRPGAVRAAVTARTREAETVRRALLGLGLDPARISAAGNGQAPPLGAVVSLSRVVLHLRDCGAAIQPATDPGLDVAASLDSIGRCVGANNLAAMLADPGDLLTSPPLEPQPGIVAAGAIARARGQIGLSASSPGAAASSPAAGSESPAGAGAVAASP